MVAIVDQNAFNLARWDELENIGISGYLKNIIDSYPNNRCIQFENKNMKVNCVALLKTDTTECPI